MHTNTNRRFTGRRWWPTFFTSAYAPNVFEQRLAQLARRLQRKQTLNKAPREIAIVFVATIILGLVISSLIGTQIATMIGAAVVGASAVTLIGRAFVIPSPPTTALAYDRQLDLHERLSTSVTDELRTDSAIQALQRKDAVRTIETIDAAGAFPYALRRVDLLLLVASTTALITWFITSPVVTLYSAPPTNFTGVPRTQQFDNVTVPALSVDDPGVQSRMEHLQAAIDELQRNRDPETLTSLAVSREAAAALRQSPESRQLSRALNNQDFDLATAEIRELMNQLVTMNSAQLDRLATSFRSATNRSANTNSALEKNLRATAQNLEDSHLVDAHAALGRMADVTESLGTMITMDREIEEQIEHLTRQLASLQDSLGIDMPRAENLPNTSIGPVTTPVSSSDPDGSTAAAPAAGGSDSSAQGHALRGTLETLPRGQRLNTEGKLEVIDIAPTSEAAKLVERPVLELGPTSAEWNATIAGNRGRAIGRPDVDRNTPLDLLPLLDRYFTAN